MVEIAPFKAIRFNPNKFSNLSNVISPPYDVISVPEYDKLLKRHPQNIVRIELPLAQGKQDRYAVAAALWQKWERQRILSQDKLPSFYGYEQRFSVGNEAYFRRGFFAALRIEAPGKGRVRPHERTFPKHKEDRLKLMRATHANVSPIFGIFFDRQQKAQKLIAERMTQKPALVSRDDKGVTHRLWCWSDPEARKILTAVLRAEDVLIADGHHRYETSWTYAQERGRKDRAAHKRKKAYRYVMTFLCPLADPGLVIQPTHRAVSHQASLDEWKQRIEPVFTMQPVTGLSALLSRLRATKEHTSLGMVLEGGKLFWLKMKQPGGLTLPVVPLHEKILEGIALDHIFYGQDPRDLVQNLQRGEANAAFLLPPPDKEVFANICRAGKLLPQKSTYFFPKVTTGLVMRSLDGDV
jgi:uncharacterized protein (DUF1015 family)